MKMIDTKVGRTANAINDKLSKIAPAAMPAVEVNENGEQLVNARDLHKFLEVKSDFRNWIKNAIRDFGFEENVDYGSYGKNLPKSTG